MNEIFENRSREKTYRVAISALKSNPAYLTLFCLGLMGGPVVAGAIFKTDQLVAATATVSWLIFLLASIFVVAFVETRQTKSSDSSLIPTDEDATANFLSSKSASKLSGRWQVCWYKGTGEERQPYDPDPEEIAVISSRGPGLFIHSYDPSTKNEYWLIGRLSDKLDVTLFYWGKPDDGMLVGVVFLELDDSFDAKGNKMAGSWQGRTRDGEVTIGDVEFIRLGFQD